jgi:DNA-binding PadR family transcriptional regulator
MTTTRRLQTGFALSPKEALILALLAREGELYGLELVAASDGELRRGTVYVTLARMEEKGYVAARPPPKTERTPGLPRPRYRATALGLRVLDAARAIAARPLLAKGTT